MTFRESGVVILLVLSVFTPSQSRVIPAQEDNYYQAPVSGIDSQSEGSSYRRQSLTSIHAQARFAYFHGNTDNGNDNYQDPAPQTPYDFSYQEVRTSGKQPHYPAHLNEDSSSRDETNQYGTYERQPRGEHHQYQPAQTVSYHFNGENGDSSSRDRGIQVGTYERQPWAGRQHYSAANNLNEQNGSMQSGVGRVMPVESATGNREAMRSSHQGQPDRPRRLNGDRMRKYEEERMCCYGTTNF